MTNYNYDNVTISGPICTGTSTLARLLQKKTGWEHWDAGTFFRKYCRDHGLNLEDTAARSDELSLEVDHKVRKRLKTKRGLIHEGWLAGFMAHDLNNTLKVLLTCDDALRIDRLVNRDHLTVAKAKRQLKKREKNNRAKWSRVYGKLWRQWHGDKPINFFDPSIYDLVIDTYYHSKEETLKKVLNVLVSRK